MIEVEVENKRVSSHSSFFLALPKLSMDSICLVIIGTKTTYSQITYHSNKQVQTKYKIEIE